jgi:hypothetical protein
MTKKRADSTKSGSGSKAFFGEVDPAHRQKMRHEVEAVLERVSAPVEPGSLIGFPHFWQRAGSTALEKCASAVRPAPIGGRFEHFSVRWIRSPSKNAA